MKDGTGKDLIIGNFVLVRSSAYIDEVDLKRGMSVGIITRIDPVNGLDRRVYVSFENFPYTNLNTCNGYTRYNTVYFYGPELIKLPYNKADREQYLMLKKLEE
jgi:hypothetical protein